MPGAICTDIVLVLFMLQYEINEATGGPQRPQSLCVNKGLMKSLLCLTQVKSGTASREFSRCSELP